ncbi:MAG TPA: transcriptional repressor LexA [Myxococcota bacterium]|nr:transcriptional repressor LexA [Myxococcota bacterium]
MRELTARQQQLLSFIEEYAIEHGFPPAIREMADHMGISSTNGVNDHLKALERKGYLSREKGLKSRAIRLAAPSRAHPAERDDGAAVLVPLLGRVAAGLPVMSEENLDRELLLDRSLLPASGKVFALCVRGDSMTGRGILDGDLVLVRSQQSAVSGDIVVAMLDGEVTVKTYRRSRESVVLEPANPAFEPIVIRRRDFASASILGVVSGLVRQI